MDEGGSGRGGWFITLVIGVLLSHFFWPTKYEGETAEHWFSQYDEYVSLYEQQMDLTNEKTDCLSEIESNADYFFDDFYELQTKLDDIRSTASYCQ